LLKKIITFPILLCILFTSCLDKGNKVTIVKTAGEMISEFKTDWKSAHKYYRGKYVEISGVFINGGGYIGIEMGEYPVDNGSYDDYYNKHDLLIGLELNEINYFKQDEKLIIRGKYNGFFNGKIYKGIRIKNCDIISREVIFDKARMKEFFKIIKE